MMDCERTEWGETDRFRGRPARSPVPLEIGPSYVRAWYELVHLGDPEPPAVGSVLTVRPAVVTDECRLVVRRGARAFRVRVVGLAAGWRADRVCSGGGVAT